MGYVSLPSANYGTSSSGSATSPWTTNSSSVGTPGTDPSDAPTNARHRNWLPLETTFKSWANRLITAPGVGKTANFRFHYGANQNIGAVSQITGTATEVIDTIEATAPALDPASDSTLLDTINYATTWPTTSGNAITSGMAAIEYVIASNLELAWYVCNTGGTGTATCDFGAADQYSGVVDQAISAGQNTQAPWQIRMPIQGKLKYAWAVWRGYTTTTTVEAALQVGTRGGGVDTAILFTMVGAAVTTTHQGAIDSSNVISVALGEYIGWRLKRTAGAATTGAIQLGVGFAAGL